MAARIRKSFGEEVEMRHGRYGEFQVLVDGEVAVASGALGFLGVLPSLRQTLEAVRAKLGR